MILPCYGFDLEFRLKGNKRDGCMYVWMDGWIVGGWTERHSRWSKGHCPQHPSAPIANYISLESLIMDKLLSHWCRFPFIQPALPPADHWDALIIKCKLKLQWLTTDKGHFFIYFFFQINEINKNQSSFMLLFSGILFKNSFIIINWINWSFALLADDGSLKVDSYCSSNLNNDHCDSFIQFLLRWWNDQNVLN